MSRYRSSLLGLMVGVALVTGVAAQAQDPAQTTDSRPARYASGSPSIAELRKSVVRIVGVSRTGAVSSYGSGVVIGTGGEDAPAYRYIATNAHVLAAILRSGDRPAVMAPPAKEVIPVRLSDARNPFDFDLVFLETDELKAEPMHIATDLPATGDGVRVLGFPGAVDSSLKTEADEATLGSGIVSEVKLDNWSTSDGPKFNIVQHTAPINPGNSGGALVDNCGALIGINSQDSGHATVSAQGSRIVIPAASGIYFALSGVEVERLAKRAGVVTKVDGGKCSDGAGPAAAQTALPAPAPIAVSGAGYASSSPGRSGSPVLWFAVGLAAVALILGGVGYLVLKPQPKSGRKPGAPPPSPGSPPAHPKGLALTGQDGGGAPVKFNIDAASLAGKPGGLVIGRAPPAGNLLLNDGRAKPLVSREHARIGFSAGAFHVQDAGSTNGTYVNGERLAPDLPRPLRAGDRLRFGDLDFAVGLTS